MRIVFIGAVEFSERALQRLLEVKTGAEIVGVCTLEEAPGNADHRDLSGIAREAGVPWQYTPRINAAESVGWIREQKPEAIFCFGWSRLLGPELLRVPLRGVVGFHPAALPANRGRHPLVWALVRGLAETASTFFLMDEGADTGPILHQEAVPISYSDDARTLYDKVTATALAQLEEWVPAWVEGRLEPWPQEPGAGNSWRKRGKADGAIDWRMDARAIYDLVRGLARPYVGAHFLWKGKEIKVWRCEEVAAAVPENLEPGKVLDGGAGGPVIKAGRGAVRLRETQPTVEWTEGEYL